MARVKPLNKIADIKLTTLEDIADASANEVRNQVREKGVIKGAFKAKKGRFRNTSFIDLTFSGNTLDSYMRIDGESNKKKQVVGFTSKEAANVAKGWGKRKYNLFQPSVIKAIEKKIDNATALGPQ